MKPSRWMLILFGLIVMAMGTAAYADTQDKVPAPTQTQIPAQTTVNFTRTTHGQYVVGVMVNGQGPYQFMLDTAASRSSLFSKTARKLGVDVPADRSRMVNGMVMSKLRPVVRIDTLAFAHVTLSNHQLIVLTDWPLQDAHLDGVLGMDMLGALTLRFSHKKNELTVGSGKRLNSKVFRKWANIKLGANPYMTDTYGLKFIGAKTGKRSIPAVLDLGSSFSAINWRAVRNTSLDKEKARLREAWKINGAIGEFSPKLKIRLETLDLGSLRLRESELIVMDFDHLPINNYGKYPLLILGTNLIDERDFAADFIADRIYVKLKREDRRKSDLEGEYLRRALRQGRMP